jgi:hypothetical protein
MPPPKGQDASNVSLVARYPPALDALCHRPGRHLPPSGIAVSDLRQHAARIDPPDLNGAGICSQARTAEVRGVRRVR